jgi:hypothetical protein
MTMTQRMVTVVCALACVAGSGSAIVRAQTPGGTQEGIKVHGHWVIEVRNPDGSLAERREIENGLSVAGGPLLAGLLTRGLSAGYWTIALAGGPNSACSPAPGSACRIQQTRPAGQPGDFPPGPGISDTLTVNLGAGNNSVVLQGMVTAPATGIIDLVITTLGACVPSTAPTSCSSFNLPNTPPYNTIGSTEFSRRLFAIPPAIPTVNVVSGQIVQVTVTITFS